jgi:hypothetical protein
MKNLLENWRKFVVKESFNIPEFLRGSVVRDVVYHGSNELIEPGGSLKPSDKGEFGIYLSPSRRYAKMYGYYLHKALVNIKNPKVVEYKGEISPKDLTEEDIDKLKKEGYDGIVVTSGNIEDASEIVAFDSEQVYVLEVK